MICNVFSIRPYDFLAHVLLMQSTKSLCMHVCMCVCMHACTYGTAQQQLDTRTRVNSKKRAG